MKVGPRTYKPFVAHRVAEVEEETKVGEWRWVLNVADDATRGTPSDFGPDHRWFRGPDFLYHSEESWPREPELTEPATTGEERVATTRGLPRIIDALPQAASFSSWLRLVRATARALQYIELCRGRHTTTAGRMKRTRRDDNDPAWTTGRSRPATTPRVARPTSTNSTVRYIDLEAHHVKAAEKLWWRAAQEESFGDDLRRLRQQLPVDRDSPLRALSVGEDGEGVLRLRSRIDANRELPEERRYPPIPTNLSQAVKDSQ
ncbi:RNase H and integrase-like protein [Operophtera brumata]|uniref:RNase H and integrase-like protein n=1 Tax=Operophtera brumata TaxID=104452 RepID=A0A0L7KQM8_OPEBR|nr:RNase H and integrase-like protein [Operophtera brumata]